MKKALLFILAILFFNSSFAQDAPPEMFKFQAIIKNSRNKVLKNKTIGVEVSIYQTAINGTPIYSETFTPKTSSSGMINLEIGNGSPTTGLFSNILWGTGKYFMEVSVDITGGNNYTSMGGSQLLSVPYALFAKKAISIEGSNDTDDTNEIQTLTLLDNVLTLSNINGGDNVTLPILGILTFYYADRDDDGYGDKWNVVASEFPPHDGFVIDGTDCDDSDPAVNPGAEEIPEDGVDQNCDGVELYLDNDLDTFTSDVDCDDFDNTIYPGAEEICDGKDNDCDGSVDNDCVLGDCDALLASILQYTDENCGGFSDTNCVVQSPNFDLLQYCIDMSCIANIAINNQYPANWESFTYEQGAQWLISQCGNNDEDGDGITPENGDCDDFDSTIYPGAPEICDDGIDQDCNGVDSLCNDADQDGYVDINFGGDDCDDSNEMINPGMDEICGDNIDQDCDGFDLNCDDADLDRDGFTIADGDCNDSDPNIYPAAPEICGDGLDNNCDGQFDEGCSCTDGEVQTCGDGGTQTCVNGIWQECSINVDTDQDGIFDYLDNCPTIPNQDQIDTDQDGIGDVCESYNIDSNNAMEAALAMGINQGLVNAQWILPDGTLTNSISNYHIGHGILDNLGPNNLPREGEQLVGLSTGIARAPDDPSFVSGLSYSKGYQIQLLPGFPLEVPGCPSAGAYYDGVALRITLQVPSGINGASFDTKFFSTEYPTYVCTVYNDQVAVIVNPAPQGAINGNVVFDSQSNPLGVNSGDFNVCDGCPLGTGELQGTGFEGHGGTSWLQSTFPVTPNSIIEIIFMIWDSGDATADSMVLFDNWQWLTNTTNTGTGPSN